mmetsp:Transcript_39689/g.86522  ORF Transcript_39689/g.86522 Transcript_39689/m.86522 type:complete len:515 (-) Transcript_39689:482-2026(-)
MMLLELELGMCRREANNRLQRTGGDSQPRLPLCVGVGLSALPSHAQVHIPIGHLNLSLLGQHRCKALAVPEVFLQEVDSENLWRRSALGRRRRLLEDLSSVSRLLLRLHFSLHDARMDLLHTPAQALVLGAHRGLPQDLSGDFPVDLLRRQVADDVDEVETGEKRVRHADVLGQRLVRVEGAIDRIRRCDDSAPCVQRHMHARLSDGHTLLLHRLVDGNTIVLAHLVELVDADGTPISEDHGTGLKVELPAASIPDHCRSETRTTGAPAGGAHGQLGHIHHEAEHLRLPARGVADEENINIATQVGAIGEVLLRAAHHLQEQPLLYFLVAADRRGEGACKKAEGIRALGDLLDVAQVVAHKGRLEHVLDQLYIGRDQPRRPNAIGEVLESGREGAVHTGDLDTVAWLTTVDEIALDDDLDVAWDLPCRGLLRALLNVELLHVLVRTQPNLHHELVTLVILVWHAPGGGLAHQRSNVPVVPGNHPPVVRILPDVDGLHQFRHVESGLGNDALHTH